MTTDPTRCQRYSPRTEKRLSEKQRRREMVINDDIADKLHHADFNLEQELGQYSNQDVSLRYMDFEIPTFIFSSILLLSYYI